MSFLYNQLSFILYFLACFNLGWILMASHLPVWMWVFVIIALLLLAEALASPWAILRRILLRWISTDTRAFVGITILAMLLVIVLSWFDISLYIVLLITTASLVRLNLQTAAIGDIKAFSAVSFLALAALGSGGWLNWYLSHTQILLKIVGGNQ